MFVNGCVVASTIFIILVYCKYCEFQHKIIHHQYLFGHLLMAVQELSIARAVAMVREVTTDHGSNIAICDAVVRAYA